MIDQCPICKQDLLFKDNFVFCVETTKLITKHWFKWLISPENQSFTVMLGDRTSAYVTFSIHEEYLNVVSRDRGDSRDFMSLHIKPESMEQILMILDSLEKSELFV